MIQSSQPISLKFTWSRLRGFLAALAAGARRIRRWVNRYSSRFLLLPNARKKAFSLLVLPCRAKPRERRSTGRPPLCSRASRSKHSCWGCCFCWFLNPLKIFHTSNTSHFPPNPPSRSSKVFVWTGTASCFPEAQVDSFRHGDEIPPPPPSEAADPVEALRGSDRRFLRMRSSAPRSPSRSRELTLK
uniref:Uncharacterized protein n=1 Tax=Cyclopterus lumpus TaxID=8103 RepID=A0A8C3AL06_CYCLU